MAVRFQLRRDTAANWASVNPVLALGEPGVETDTLKVKVGDGATVWNSLAYSISNDFADITNPPTTLAGYGITDALSLANLSVGAEATAAGDGAIAYNNATGVFTYTPPDTSTFLTTVAYADLTSKPTTLSGYGITDAATTAQGALADSAVQPGNNIETSIIDSADSSAITITPDVVMSAGLTVGNHIIPSSNENIDLGSDTNRFRELFLSGNTISLDGIKLSSTGTALRVHDGNNTRRNIESHNIDANDVTVNNITAAGDIDVTGNLTMTGYIAGPATFTIDPAAVGDNTGVVVIAGDLQVDGTTTTINSTTLEVEDKNVVLGPNAANDAANNGAGLTVTQPDTSDASLIYNTTDTQWELNKDLDVTGAVTADELTVSGTTELNGNTTVDGWLRIQGSTGSIFLTDTDVSAQSKIWQTGENLYIDNQSAIGGDTYFRTDNGKIRQIIRDNGDISWRNTAGTADGLHWDAADMRLGIGTNNPGRKLTIAGGDNAKISFTGGGTQSLYFGDGAGADEYAGYIHYAHADDNMRFNTTGDFTFRGGNVTVEGTTKSEQYLLDAIDTTISDTAVDVFIYDTRKDSDGGAWRKRTQGTSWYNETLNTATRGSRKGFPAVAVIVAESNQVTIYDGDDPDIPMWMVFETGANTIPWTSTVANVYFLNGLFCIGCDGREVEANFISEAVTLRDATYWYEYLINIKGRNDVPGTTPILSTTKNIINSTVNDVAMTVLPHAPIDSATGLPVPTIAVATDGGVSVIKDDGTVVDITHTVSVYKGAKNISFNGNQISYATQQSGVGTTYWRKVYIDIPISDLTGAYASSLAGATNYDARGTTGNKPALNTDADLSAVTNNIIDSVHDKAFGFSNKLTLLDVDTFSDTNYPIDSSVAYITSDYNTGWMNGDIKLATLSDTDDTDITATELVTNGNFSTGNLSGWTLTGDVTPTYDSGTNGAKMQTAASVDGTIFQSITPTVGVVVTYSVDALTSGYFGLYLNGSLVSDNITTSGTYTTSSTVNSIQFAHRGGGGGYGIIDNISVTQAEPDRSVNGNGLQVFGTITKTAVATGADLVGYSGFSAGNNIQQPYNSDMDIGASDDVCVITWAKLKTGNSYIFDRTDDANTGPRYFAYRRGGQDDKLVFFGLASSTAFTDAFVADWHQYTLLRRGGMIEIWVDGKLDATIADTSDKTNTSAKLTIGNNYTHSANNAASDLALFRFSVTAPSPEQIKKIYEDEKHLFQEGAQATLHGSSDAVTALAYDDDTELLHVGTSAGRSVFQGLRRIDNTTDAVGAAISASNGMVAED